MPKFKGNVFIRKMPGDLHKTLVIMAAQKETSLNALLIELLRNSVDGDKKKGA